MLNPRQALYRVAGSCAVNLNGERFRGDPDHSRFWRKASSGRWEPETFAILSRYLKPTSVYCDVGAWIGPTVLYASRKARQVLCFEPDFVAYRYLLWNLELNRLQNVTPFNLAITQSPGLVAMSGRRKRPGDSTTSLLNATDRANSFHVLGMPWERWLELVQPEHIDFMKVDIEGYEFELLPRMASYFHEQRPIVFLSTHGHMIPAGERKLAFEALIGTFRSYSQCLDEHFNPVPIETLATEPICSRPGEFLFLP